MMRGYAEHIIFANECNKFSNKWQRIWDFIYYITVKTIGISIFQLGYKQRSWKLGYSGD